MPDRKHIDKQEWEEFVQSHADGSIYQSAQMYDFFKTVSHFEPVVLANYSSGKKMNGLLLGVVINEKWKFSKLLSSRLVVWGGPLLTGTAAEQKDTVDHLLSRLIKLSGHKALFIQFRNFFPQQELLPVYYKHGFEFLDRLNYIIQLPPAGNQPHKMSNSRRRQIRKGLASGAEIIEAENIEQVKEFYNILFKLYRYKIRKPLPDWSFFESFYHLSSQNPGTRNPEPGTPIGIIRLIKYNDRIIGGILCPATPGKCIYEWYVCGLDKEYKEQYPSVLATWAGIEYAVENGYRCFDFMGVGKPGIEYGVRDFKARFGGEMVNHGRITRINNRFLYNLAELGYNALAAFKKI